MKPFQAKTRFGKIVAVTSKSLRQEVRDKIAESGLIFLDTETGIEDDTEESSIWVKRLRLVQICCDPIEKKPTVYLIDPSTDAELIGDIINSNAKLVSHNAAFDLSAVAGFHFSDGDEAYDWLAEQAVKQRAICTMISDQVRDKRSYYASLALLSEKEGIHDQWSEALKDRGAELGVEGAEVYEVIDIDDEVYLNYSAHDIFQVRAVYASLMEDGYIDHPLAVTETSVSILYTILKMRGVRIDFDLLQEVMTEKDYKRSQIIMKLGKYGVTKLFSAKEIHTAIEDTGLELPFRTPSGRPKMDKSILAEVAASDNKTAAKIATLVSKGRGHHSDFAMLNQINENSDDYGRVHPDLRGIGTRTSRSSCRLPNLQQVNKTTGDPRVRMCLLPRKGMVAASVDYSGIEVRAIADVAEDKVLRKKLIDGADVHGEIAINVYGDEYTPRQRARAKNGVFAMLYGASDKSIARQIGCSLGQAATLRESWESFYTKVVKESKKWTKRAERDGFIELPSGWITSTVDYDADDEEDSAAYRAVNYMIQGWASYVVKIAAIQIAAAGLWRYVDMVIHDEYVLSLPKKQAKQLIEKIIKAGKVKTEFMTYDLDGEIYGKSWK